MSKDPPLSVSEAFKIKFVTFGNINLVLIT